MKRHGNIALTAAAALLAATVASAASHTSQRRTHAFAGRHEMTGTVTRVDRTTGKIQVEADGQKLDLHFPRSALTHIEPGDQVAVELAIREVTPGQGAATRTHTPDRTSVTNGEHAGDNPGNPGELPGEHTGGLTR